MQDDKAKLLYQVQQLPGYRRLTEEGVAQVQEAIFLAPVRRVGKGALMNMTGQIPENGRPVQFESEGGESPYVLWAQLNNQIVISQPIHLRVKAYDVRGRRAWKTITTDYLECAHEAFSLVEVKFLDAVKELATKYPEDWVRDEQDEWHYRPGEEATSRWGMRHRVFIPDRSSKQARANLLYRVQVARSNVEPCSPRALAALVNQLKNGALSVKHICASSGKFSGGQLLQAVEQQKLFGLLDRQIFDGDFLIFGSEQDMARHREMIDALLPPSEEPGPLFSRLLRASKAEMTYATQHMEIYNKDRRVGALPNATTYRQETRIRDVLEEGAPLLAAFIPNFQGRGGAGQPIDEATVTSIKKYLPIYLKSAKGKAKPSKAMTQWLKQCPEHKGALSEESFRKFYHQFCAPEKTALIGGGLRSFHRARPRTDGRHMNPRAKMAGLHCHIDGVFGDAYAVGDEEREFLRPIYFPIVDDVHQYVLARGIKIGRPSRLALGMALRDCVARHRFLALVLTSDRGSELFNDMAREASVKLNFQLHWRPSGALAGC